MLKYSIIYFIIALVMEKEAEAKIVEHLLIGTYSGGCGFSQIEKSKLVQNIANQFKTKYNIEIQTTMVNFSSKKEHAYVFPDDINKSEFNVFFYIDKEMHLIATSCTNYKDQTKFYSYIQNGISKKNEFFESVVKDMFKLYTDKTNPK